MRLIYTFFLLWGSTLLMHAQVTDKLREAQENYEIGRLEQAHDSLQKYISTFAEDKASAYRLLSLCCLALDKNEEADENVRKLLSIDRYYSARSEDPQRFIDMVNRRKEGLTSTITTASSQAEKLSEVPVPVVLITEEMIRNSCARNLKEVLLAYVPSMNDVDCNDDINIAMRGIYNNGQEKILIMLNGHRINSYCTNIASPDFSLSLEKVKQIEVLRGPASSLYGGVALTAVVNIITKQGGDIDGLKVKGGIGNFGQWRGDILFGKRYFDTDILIWGSLYKRKGERFWVSAENTGLKLYSGNIVVGGIGNKPSYDMGVCLTWKNRLTFLYDTHFSQVVSPYTASYSFSPYDLDRYITFNGIKPSFATRSHHLDMKYNRSLFNDRLHLVGGMTYDNSDLTHYQVISDSAINNVSSIVGFPPVFQQLLKGSKGLFRFINGQENTLGVEFRGDLAYVKRENNEGFVTVGAQFSHFKLEDVRYVVGVNFNEMFDTDLSSVAIGSENSFNTFLQLKQRWRNFILNAGLRYDHRRHYNETSINELSPRLAMIFVQPKWNVKLSYSKSFVDAPYLYRKTNAYMATYDNGDTEIDLGSEYLNSFQLTLAGDNWVDGLSLELNGFYNQATNLIYTSILKHANAGTIKTIGVEFIGNYKLNSIFSNLTVSWQRVLESEIYERKINDAYNIPKLTINAVLGVNVTKKLVLHGHLGIESSQTCFMVDLEKRNIIESKLNGRALLDLGARYKFNNMFELGMNGHNVLNHQYYRGGFGSGQIHQPGRSVMAYLALKF